MLNNKWFIKSSEVPTGSTQNDRFAERLNSVWLNYDRESRLHPGRMIKGFVRLGKFLTDLNQRVLKLEQAAKPALPMEFTSLGRASSANRTATGVAAMNANWRLPKYDPPVVVVYLDGYQIEIKRDPNV